MAVLVMLVLNYFTSVLILLLFSKHLHEALNSPLEVVLVSMNEFLHPANILINKRDLKYIHELLILLNRLIFDLFYV